MSRYVAYVGSYTDTNDAKGLTLFDVDVENGTLTKRTEYTCSNASYITVSHNRKFLYAITDLGVVSFAIQPDGSLKRLNTAPIRGMRGCHISLTKDNRYMFVSGYYDGKITVLKINDDGSAGKITDHVFHQGPGSIAERNYRPHIRCARLSPDEKYIYVVDSGIDQIRIYRFDPTDGKIRIYNTLHCRLTCGPRFLRFSSDGRFFYSLKELNNTISVYKNIEGKRGPEYELQNSVSTLGKKYSDFAAAVTFTFTPDEKYLLCTNAGDNSLGIFARDEETGLLDQKGVLPVSGSYPTSIGVFPDAKHIFLTNHDSNSITFFKLEAEKGLILMSAPPIKVPQPNCNVIVKLDDIQFEEETKD